MARPKNENNTYKLVCKVTNEEVPTNPKQFRDLVARYGITDAELKDSYVSRKGRKILADEKLNVEQAVTKYGLHVNVANALKAVVKPKPEKVVAPAPETPAVESVTETPVVETVVPAVEPEAVTEEVVTVEA